MFKQTVSRLLGDGFYIGMLFLPPFLYWIVFCLIRGGRVNGLNSRKNKPILNKNRLSQ